MKADFFISLCHFFGMTVSPLTIVQCPRVAEHLVLLAAAKSLQSCPTLCDPVEGSPPGSPVPGTLQARTVEWVAISFSNAWKWKVKGKSLGRVRLFTTPWTAAYQAPPSMGFSRQEYWCGGAIAFSRHFSEHLLNASMCYTQNLCRGNKDQ